jgi:rRNA processing protein Krr1/Pno1
MDYPKLIELVPAEKWGPLQMKNGTANTKSGLTILLEAAVLVAAEKTVSALGDLQLLKVAELIVQNMLSGENKNDA